MSTELLSLATYGTVVELSSQGFPVAAAEPEDAVAEPELATAEVAVKSQADGGAQVVEAEEPEVGVHTNTDEVPDCPKGAALALMKPPAPASDQHVDSQPVATAVAVGSVSLHSRLSTQSRQLYWLWRERSEDRGLTWATATSF